MAKEETTQTDRAVRPARPHTGLTGDGRRIREVLTYARRGSRLTDAQAEAWTRLATSGGSPRTPSTEPGFDLPAWFGREAPLIVEIGSGVGEATAALAAARPSYDVLALRGRGGPGSPTVPAVEQAGLDNVRLVQRSTRCGRCEHLLGDGEHPRAVDVLPRPVAEEAAPQAPAGRPRSSRAWPRTGSSRRACGGWPPTGGDYAEQMVEVLDAEPLLHNVHDGPAPRWAGPAADPLRAARPGAGRSITDLTYRRIPASI